MTTQFEQRDADVEQALRRTRFTTPADLDERILTDATRALHAPSAAGRLSNPMRFWRRAAIVLLAIGAAAVLFAYLDRPSLTLAQVTAEYAKQKWVHVKYDNGQEHWTDLADGRYFFKDHDGRTVYTEPNGLRLWWRADGTYISKDKWFRGDKPPSERRDATPWDRFVAPYETAAAKPGEGKPSIERHDDALGGRKLTRFDCYHTDAMDRRLLIRQVWADPRTRLPVQDREVLNLADRQEQKREAIVGKYDFPTTGPSSIHDVGVPQGLAVIDSEAKPADDVAKVLEAAQAARDRFPSRHRLIVWTPADEMGAVDLIYRDGERFARTRYFVSDQPGVPPFPKNAVLDQVLAWLGTRVPVEIEIDDGTREFRRFNNIYDEPGKPPATVRVTKFPKFPDNPNYLPGTQWPYLGNGSGVVLLDPPPDAAKGLIILRRTFGDRRIEAWIDPSKDYACARDIWQNRVGGKWVDDRVTYYSDFAQAAGGQWYATDRRTEMSANAKLGTSASTHHEKIELKVLKPEEIPPGTFDGEKLLKDAKLESY
ncbi:MAG: hypothetical protein M3478_01335 [Planctomycetota bacterium]|nr:hypothetical protein [Planctomycetota bacterium]